MTCDIDFSYEKRNTLNRLFTKTVDHLPHKVAVKKLCGNVDKVGNLTEIKLIKLWATNLNKSPMYFTNICQ